MTLLLTGCLTYYLATGNPLRCTDVPWSTDDRWIAIDIDHYEGWGCNDWARVTVGDDVMLLQVRDSGPLSKFCIYNGDTCTEIVGDLPRHAFIWPGLSVRGIVENVTGALRARLERER